MTSPFHDLYAGYPPHNARRSMGIAAAMEQVAAIEAAGERLRALSEACDVWGAGLEFAHDALRACVKDLRAFYTGREMPVEGGFTWSVKK